MNTEKQQLREQIEKDNIEIKKYKCIVEQYKTEMDKLMDEYEQVKNETKEARETIENIKKEMEEFEKLYNHIKSEYVTLESEFMKIIELSETNTETCILTLREYANKFYLFNMVKEPEYRTRETFKVIKGGKTD